MNTEKLQTTAQVMVAAGKGILAMDESHPTCKKRFDQIGVEATEESRRLYRQMLVTAPGLGRHISAAILFDETIRQTTGDGGAFADHLNAAGIVPGIKVDKGVKPLANCEGEKVTEGLDGLRERLAEYAGFGARFAKWRAVIAVGDALPSAVCVRANARALADYAALCQEQDLVPIVEPEVLMDGGHTIERCFEVTESVQRAVFAELAARGVFLEGIVLKPNMVVSGAACTARADSARVADMTLRCLKRTVPAAVPGIAFLSGGQGDVEATANLDAINRLAAREGAPWRITFSYGRALQQCALTAWGGEASQAGQAQQALCRRARLNGAASGGAYEAAMEAAA